MKYYKKIIIILAFLAPIFVGQSCFAELPKQFMNSFSQNDILFYDPCEGSGGSGGGGGLLAGDTTAEKVWNYLTSYFEEKQISGVNTTAVVSGIMGNFFVESGVNPLMAGASGSYMGIYMLRDIYGGNDYLSKVNAAIGSGHVKFYGWWSDEHDADKVLKKEGLSEEQISEAVRVNLEVLTNEGNSGWKEFLTGLKDWGVADTARGYSDLFLVTIERAVNGDSPIEDPGVRKHYSGYYQGAEKRRSKADYFFKEYGKKAGSSSSSSNSTSASSSSSNSSSSSSSSSNSSSSSSSNSSTVSGKDITWIGDSYSVQADNKGLLEKNFSGLDIGPSPNNTATSYIKGSKTVASTSSSNPGCLNILEKIIKAKKLRPYLVFACGTNGGWDKNDNIKKFQALIKNQNVKAIVVTSKIVKNVDYTTGNKNLQEMAKSNEKVFLADWTKVYDKKYFASDPEGIHPTSDPGYEKWVGVISEALNEAAGGGGDDCEASGENLTKEQAQAIADYYNSDKVTVKDFNLPSGTKENCVSLVAWFEAQIGDFYDDNTRVTWGDGYQITTYLKQHHNVPTGKEPKPFSIFSTVGGHWHSSNHTGIVVSVEGKKVISIEAAYGGWRGESNGLAKVFEMQAPTSGIEYAYIADRLEYDKLSEIIGSVKCAKSNSNCPSEDSGTGVESAAVGEAAKVALNDRMKWLFPDGTPKSESEMKKYLQGVEVPIKDEQGNETTMTLTVHKKLAEEIKAVFQDLLNVSKFRTKKSATGAYTWRMMASGTGSLSHHSYGVAIDLNWNDNPASYTGGTYNPGGNYYSVTKEVVDVWKKHGFYWGGDWSGYYKDYMHFTYTNH